MMLLLLACTGAPATRSASDWQNVVLLRLCEKYGDEFSKTRSVAVLEETQPIFDFAGLASVDAVDVTPDAAREIQRVEDEARGRFVAVRVSLPACRCNYKLVPSQPRYRDVIQLEMSSIVTDPFRPSTGVFVRSSAGGRPGATWFWVTVSRSPAGEWSVGSVSVLPTQDA